MGKMVSVVIPTYSRKELTDQAIESVVTSFPDLLEIVVVDDCSAVAYSFGGTNSSDVPVRVIRLESNVGAGMARKEGVAQAAGEFIALLDSDDRYDEGWMDYVVNLLQRETELLDSRLLISGITDGERRAGGLVRRLLAGTPMCLQLTVARLVATLFNPFYTPSMVLRREICFFKDGLRHCEDYYTTARALFSADKILLPQVVSCHLGRAPNSRGGESAEKVKMFRGEMKVRQTMLGGANLSFAYKPFVPLGMVYQWCRAIVKRLLSL